MKIGILIEIFVQSVFLNLLFYRLLILLFLFGYHKQKESIQV